MGLPKKVFLVSNTAWYLYNFRKGVILYLLEKGYKVYCVAPKDDYSPLLKDLGVDILAVSIDSKGINPIKDLIFFSSLIRLYRKYRPSLVYHYTIKPNIYGSVAASLFRIPSISVVSGAGIVFLKRNLLFSFVKRLYTFSARRANEMWFVNGDDLQFFLQEEIIAVHKTRLLPGEGVNTAYFHRRMPYNHIITKKFTFLFSGRLLKVKGIEAYVKAAKRLKEEGYQANFDIIGFYDKESPVGVDPKEMTIWEKENGVTFLGSMQDVRPVLEEVHCLVFPSYYREGMPRVLLEASSMEIPIITTDNVGCKEVVVDGVNGLICLPKNDEAVYQNMKKILNLDKRKLEQMGKNGRKIIMDKFDEKFVLHFYKASVENYLK